MDMAAPGRWITPLLLGALAGTALQVQQAELLPAWAYLALALGAVCVLVMRRLRTRSLLFLAGALLAFSQAGLRADAMLADALRTDIEGKDLVLTGVVAAMPQSNEAGLRLRFEVEGARSGGEDVQVPPVVALGWFGDPASLPDVRAGERWRLAARLKAPHGSSNPNGFDFELWMWEQGLQASGSVRAGPRDAAPERLAATWLHPVESARQRVRERIYAQVEDRRWAGIVAALVVGDQAAIERADWDVFRATGVAHLMSISGLHITMFAWLAGACVGWLWRRSARLCLLWPSPHAALVAGVVLASAYSLFSGWGVPSRRTVLMLATVALLRLSGRRWPWTLVWLLACAVVVLTDPWAMLQAGFWLSFVAVGVLFASGPAPQARGWKQRLQGAAREQWLVTVGLTPLTLLLFGQVSLVGLLANALAIPWVTLVVTPLAMAGIALPLAWSAAAQALAALGAVLQWLAAWPWASISAPAAPLWAALAAVLGGVVLALPIPRALKLLALPLVLPALLWQVPRPAPGEFDLMAADIGQGNALIVRTASHTLVYDSGPRYGVDSDAGHRVLVPLLRALGEHVDTLVLSHRDTDHTGGAAAVLAMQPDAALLSSIEEGHELQSLRRATRCTAGQAWSWDGVSFEVLHPREEDYVPGAKPNSLSCVLKVGNGRASALLAGDVEAPQEAAMLAHAQPVAADVLLVPHHGSKTSSTAAFLAAVHPGLALVQAGYRNRFGHPAAPVMERYRAASIRVVDTPHCGAATWRSVDPALVHCERESAHRYWHHRVP